MEVRKGNVKSRETTKKKKKERIKENIMLYFASSYIISFQTQFHFARMHYLNNIYR